MVLEIFQQICLPLSLWRSNMFIFLSRPHVMVEEAWGECVEFNDVTNIWVRGNSGSNENDNIREKKADGNKLSGVIWLDCPCCFGLLMTAEIMMCNMFGFLYCSSSLCPRPVLQMSVTLGAGPRWWSWCAPRRRRVIPIRGEQRCGEGQRALCEPALQ